MRRFSNPYHLLALAGLLSVVAWGCTTDSPTAPRQEVPPIPPTSGQAYFISVDSDPGGIVLSETGATGFESATISIDIRLDGPGGPRPADGTTMLVTTSLGSFSSLVQANQVGVSVVNGQAFLTLFAGGLPAQLGIATVQAFREDSGGETRVPIAVLEAAFEESNPEENLSIQFYNESFGNPTDFLWQFGDGTTSTESDPGHLFPAAGTYRVKFTVSKTVAGVKLSDSVAQDVVVTEPVEVLP